MVQLGEEDGALVLSSHVLRVCLFPYLRLGSPHVSPLVFMGSPVSFVASMPCVSTACSRVVCEFLLNLLCR